MGTDSFRWSRIQPAETLEASRAMRFRSEMRPILLNYFGLAPGMEVLEVGCGPDTMATYMAEGLTPGRVTGLDLDADFIHRAREKAKQRNVPNVFFVNGDACHLPFEDSAFDAVISYTGIGVLSNPEQAIQEMLRVCKAGGTISIAEAVTGRLGIQFSGIDSVMEEEPFPGSQRYHELMQQIQSTAVSAPISGVGSKHWSPQTLFGLMGTMGIAKLRLNAWGYGEAPDDARVPDEQRKRLRQSAYESLVKWLEDLRSVHQAEIHQEVFDEAVRLTHARYDWLSNHSAYDWEAGVSIVASGIKNS